MRTDLLEEKQNVAVSVARRSEAVHVYGVDLMSTGDLLSYFSGAAKEYRGSQG